MIVNLRTAINNQERGIIEWRKNRSKHSRNGKRKKRACKNERIKRRAGSNQKRLRRTSRLLSETKTLTSPASVLALNPYQSSGILLVMSVAILMGSNREPF